MDNFKTAELDYKSIKLHVDIYEHGPDAPAIIVAHGTGSYSRYYASFCRELSKKGYNVLPFDFMGHGRSGGKRGVFTMAAMLENISTVVDFAIKEYSGKVGLLGTSQGGEVAYHAALRDDRIKSLVCHNILLSQKIPIIPRVEFMQSKLCSVICAILPDFPLPMKMAFNWKKAYKKPGLLKKKRSDPLTVWKYSFKSYRSIFTYKPAKPIDSLQIPVLIAVGERDELVPKEHCEKAYNLIKSPDKEFYVMDGAAHQLLIDYPDRFVPKVDEWFKKTL